MPVRFTISTAKWQTQARALLPLLHIPLQSFARHPLQFPLRVLAPMDPIRGAHQSVQRLFGNLPAICHVEAVDQRVGLLHVNQVAHALHIGLARQHP